jgi:hypothetical protein
MREGSQNHRRIQLWKFRVGVFWRMMMSKKEESMATVIIGAVSAAVTSCLIYVVILYFFWNWIAPTVFGLPEITFLQAIGLRFLSSTLFDHSSTSNKE